MQLDTQTIHHLAWEHIIECGIPFRTHGNILNMLVSYGFNLSLICFLASLVVLMDHLQVLVIVTYVIILKRFSQR